MAGNLLKLNFKDGTSSSVAMGTKAEDVVREHFKKQAGRVLAVRLNDAMLDLSREIQDFGDFDVITFDQPEGIDLFRHSSSHIMALAIKRVFPGVKVTIGPSIEDGFYYDFDHLKMTEDDFSKVEKEMDAIIHEKLPFIRREVTREEALELFHDEPYKLELIRDLPVDEKLTTYRLGEFEDLCRGPHVPHSGRVGAIKIMKLAGAYWRGDSKNKMLTRVYGISFPEKKMLQEYLDRLAEIEKRNHVKLGKEMGLFSIHPEGPGFPFFHPKGMAVWNALLDFWRQEHAKAGYVEVKTPIMLNRALWETSGHWENYKQNMYTLKIDDQDFAVKPMNCPGGMLMYKEKLHSYKEFPLRVGEIGLVHRHELSGVLNGLLRVRCFHQDDAHIYMTSEQIKDEVLGVLNLADRFYKLFGLSYHLELSTMPETHVGTEDQWRLATEGLKSALDSTGLEYKINPGDGAFYGPKIDIHIKDALGRTWQCGTVQLDMANPERFDLTYEGSDGMRHRPVMIHRVIYGSVERFLGILIEHYGGRFPLWLSPVQAKILTISEKHSDYALKVAGQMKAAGLRVELDTRGESAAKKVRDAQVEKVNYILVVGDREYEDDSVNIRTRLGEIKGSKKVVEMIEDMLSEIREKRLG